MTTSPCLLCCAEGERLALALNDAVQSDWRLRSKKTAAERIAAASAFSDHLRMHGSHASRTAPAVEHAP